MVKMTTDAQAQLNRFVYCTIITVIKYLVQQHCAKTAKLKTPKTVQHARKQSNTEKNPQI